MASGKVIEVRNPRTGEYDATVRAWTDADISAQTERMREAQSEWAALSWQERVAILDRWSVALQADCEAVLDALSIDTGRRKLAEGEIRAIPFILSQWQRFAAEVFAARDDHTLSADAEVSFNTVLQSYPVVGVISPWNFPLLLSVLDSISALVAGSSVIVKPSEITPRFIEPLQKTIDAIPELKDVFRFVVGDGATGAALINHVDAVCFTGSVATGRKVAAASAENMIPAYLELGGKDPVVVLASADPQQSATAILRASVQATGQACQSLERIYVVADIYDDFVTHLVKAANAVELNYPDIGSGHIGPIIMEQQAAIIDGQIKDAVSKGAKVCSGGEIETHGGGLWIRPTVLTGVTQQMLVMQEETFGPVLPVVKVPDAATAVQYANDSIYGLSAAVFGEGGDARAIAAQLNAGAVSINDGGLTTIAFEAEKDSFGLSGLGKSRMGKMGLQRFLRKKALITRHGVAPDIEIMAE